MMFRLGRDLSTRLSLCILVLITVPVAAAVPPDPDHPDRTLEAAEDQSEFEKLIDQYRRNKQYERCLEAIRAGHSKGFFYFLHPHLDEFSGVEGFARVYEKNEELRQAAIAQASSTIDVVLPDGFDPNSEYPLLIVLHGGNSTAKAARSHWHSKRLGREFIVAFIQSYLHYGMATFGWAQADPRARRDIRRMFEKTVKDYPIDRRRVIVGGMSAGGETAIDTVVNRVIPAVGFIGVCPGKPLELEEATVQEARESGVRGFIIGGENDFYLGEQEHMRAIFEGADLPCEFHVISGHGHAYPSEFSNWIDSSLGFILESD